MMLYMGAENESSNGDIKVQEGFSEYFCPTKGKMLFAWTEKPWLKSFYVSALQFFQFYFNIFQAVPEWWRYIYISDLKTLDRMNQIV